MIKSKIDARERALELAVETFKGSNRFTDGDVIAVSNEYADFLIGDAELPEVTDDNAHIKELLEIANKSFDNSRKCNNDEIDCLLKGISADVASKTPRKSDVE